MEQHSFQGPIFIVGMSRSGTQLFRDLLNGNDRIRIPRNETHFIPYLLTHFDRPLSTRDRAHIASMIDRSDFRQDLQSQGIGMTAAALREATREGRIADIVERVLRGHAEPPAEEGIIWGDKTPHNMLHIPLLNRHYPTARFIHMIRDPRNRAVSARKAWGADLLLSCDEWNERVARAREAGGQLGTRYLEMHYEAVTDDPETCLKRACEHLDVAFDARMLRLSRPADEHRTTSTTAGALHVVKTDHSAYQRQLAPRTRTRMEELTHPLAQQLGYAPSSPALTYAPLSNRERWSHLVGDRFRKGTFYLRRWGLLEGTRHMFRRAKVRMVR